MSAYHKRYQQVAIELRTGNPRQLATAILAEEIDAAFVAEPIAGKQFDSVPAFTETMTLVIAKHHRAITRRTGTPRTMIAFEDGCPHRSRLEAWFAQRNTMPERVIEMSSYHAMLGCVTAGMGVSLVPASVLRGFTDAHRLRRYSLPRGLDRVRTLLIWRKGAGSPNIDALIRILRKSGHTTGQAIR